MYLGCHVLYLQAFVVVALYNLTRAKLVVVPTFVKQYSESKVAMGRLKVTP